jgi:hypothetical protein
MQNKNLSDRSNSLTPQDLEAIAMPKDAQIAEARERAFERLYQLRVANQIEREQERELRRRDVFRTAALSVVALAGVGATARTMLKETSRGQATSMSSKDMLAPTITGVELAGRFAWENVLFQAGQWAFSPLNSIDNDVRRTYSLPTCSSTPCLTRRAIALLMYEGLVWA